MMEEEIQENHLCADLCLFIDDENYEMKSCSFLKEIKHSFSLSLFFQVHLKLANPALETCLK